MFKINPVKITTFVSLTALFGVIIYFVSIKLIEQNLISNESTTWLYIFIFFCLLTLAGLWVYNNIAEREIGLEEQKILVGKEIHEGRSQAFQDTKLISTDTLGRNSSLETAVKPTIIEPIVRQVQNISTDSENQLERLKLITKILFIDDDKEFKVVQMLKKSGWKNTKAIEDVESLDSAVVRETNIFFVDINGVGKQIGFKEQGLGLAAALKTKYPDKKVVIYSAETNGERFHPTLFKVDSRIDKNAEPYEFQMIVEELSKDINAN